MYHKSMTSQAKRIESIIMVIVKNTVEVINPIAPTNNSGKSKKIMKLKITRIFTTNIKKYNLRVVFRFSRAILADVPIA